MRVSHWHMGSTQWNPNERQFWGPAGGKDHQQDADGRDAQRWTDHPSIFSGVFEPDYLRKGVKYIDYSVTTNHSTQLLWATTVSGALCLRRGETRNRVLKGQTSACVWVINSFTGLTCSLQHETSELSQMVCSFRFLNAKQGTQEQEMLNALLLCTYWEKPVETRAASCIHNTLINNNDLAGNNK